MPTADIPGVECGDPILTAASFYREEAVPTKVDREIDENFRMEIGHVTIEAIKMGLHKPPDSVAIKVTQPGSKTLVAGDELYGYYFRVPGRNPREDIENGRKALCRLREEHSFDWMTMGHVMIGFRGDVDRRLEEAERQFASFDVLTELDSYDGILQPPHVNPWRKIPGQHFIY